MKSLYSWMFSGWSSYRLGYWKAWVEILTLDHFRRKLKSGIHRARFGVSKSDVWSFDNYLSLVIINGLTHLREVNHGAPAIDYEWLPREGLNDWETDNDLFILWPAILTAMIEGFEAREIISDECPDPKSDRGKELQAQWELGSELFIEYYGALWD